MSSQFGDESVEGAFERSIRNAKHLRAKDAAMVAGARALARKIDAWNVIVDWALDDAAEDNSRPAVPSNDNVSLATFLKYLDALGLNPNVSASVSPGGKSGSTAVAKLDAFRQRHKQA